MADAITSEKIRRAMLAGPDCVTADATVAEMDSGGGLTVLRQGTNDWVCVPGNENIVGAEAETNQHLARSDLHA